MTLLLAAPAALAAPVARADVPAASRRIPALDGLRGLMTIFVVFSHFVVEVPHGIGVLSLGWVAVIVFFVLSGFLVGRLAIDRREAGNFLGVFYIRRICRTFPTYLLSTAVILAACAWLAPRDWAGATSGAPLPTWSYFLFVQNVFMVTRDSTGLHWLAPTWTLALEEQFYLLVPLLFLLAPRRAWVPLLIAFCVAGVGLRAWGVFSGLIGAAPLALIPASADVLCAGLLLAVLLADGAIDWARWSLALRASPIALLFVAAAAQGLDGGTVGPWFQVLQPALIAAVAALLILALVMGAPEARRFDAPVLRFCGDISYSVYLTHLAVLGLMHGAILGGEPDFATGEQKLVTIAAAVVTVGIGWALTRFVEQPLTAWGRGFRWSRAVGTGPASTAEGCRTARPSQSAAWADEGWSAR